MDSFFLMPYQDASLPVEQRVQDLLNRMSLGEKVGQMTLVDIRGIAPERIRSLNLGGVLSGGGAVPKDNSAAGWRALTASYENMTKQTRLHIPLLYGIDAVHGHGNLYGATIFPHNIGLGATNNPALVERIGQVTATELAATGIFWNFAPALEVPQDYRWGRTYEGFSEDTQVVSDLGSAYVRGLQSRGVAAAIKHYVGAGAAGWGTSTHERYLIDQGNSDISEQALRTMYLPPFVAAIQAGAKTVMASLNTWRGDKIHANKYLLTEVLKNELGFTGLVVSDWDGVKSLGPNYHINIVLSVNAGIDMVMLSKEPEWFMIELLSAVEKGEVSEERINDAVRRILRVKFEMGYFDDDSVLPDPQVIGSAEHRELAREAVRESLVLLKNLDNVLPLSKDLNRILVAGAGANDVGMQSGGWTMTWQGGVGEITPGTTLLQAIKATVSDRTIVDYSADGEFDVRAAVAIVVIGERPYAEGFGDRTELNLDPVDLQVIQRVKTQADQVVVMLLSGRPLLVTNNIPDWQALVAAWLPGSEGQGVTDVLFGDYPFTGKLPFTWPANMAGVPMAPSGQILWPYGFGLTPEASLAKAPISEPITAELATSLN